MCCYAPEFMNYLQFSLRPGASGLPCRVYALVIVTYVFVLKSATLLEGQCSTEKNKHFDNLITHSGFLPLFMTNVQITNLQNKKIMVKKSISTILLTLFVWSNQHRSHRLYH